MRPIALRFALLFLLGAATLAGCGDPLSLLPARFGNRVDTLFVYAASRTPVPFPSGYVISQLSSVRLDQVSTFDFLYDVSRSGEAVFMPLAAMVKTSSTTAQPGFRATTVPFDSIKVAEQTGYVTNDTIPIRAGDVFYVRSAVDPNCGLGIPYYAKLQVLVVGDSGRI